MTEQYNWDIGERIESQRQTNRTGLIEEFKDYRHFIMGVLQEVTNEGNYIINVVAGSPSEITSGSVVSVRQYGSETVPLNTFVLVSPIIKDPLTGQYEGVVQAKSEQEYTRETTNMGLEIESEFYITEVKSKIEEGLYEIEYMIYTNFAYLNINADDLNPHALPIRRLEAQVRVTGGELEAGKYYGKFEVSRSTRSLEITIYNT